MPVDAVSGQPSAPAKPPTLESQVFGCGCLLLVASFVGTALFILLGIAWAILFPQDEEERLATWPEVMRARAAAGDALGMTEMLLRNSTAFDTFWGQCILARLEEPEIADRVAFWNGVSTGGSAQEALSTGPVKPDELVHIVDACDRELDAELAVRSGAAQRAPHQGAATPASTAPH